MNAARSIARVVLAAVVAIAVPQVLKAQSGLSAADVAGRYAELPGVRLWYRDTGGKGIPVVLLHPATGSVESWVHQYDALRSAGFRVIAFDRRGSGRTQVLPEAAVPPATDADDLLRLADRLDLGRFHLLGSAAGAFGALELAVSHPDRLLSLVIANSVGGIADEELAAIGRRLRPAPLFDELPADFRELGPSYRARDPAGTQRWLEVYQRSREGQSAARPPLRYEMSLQSLQKIRTPTLLITGDADLYAPPPVQELFRRHIPGATMVIIPEAGHSAFWEQPDLFNQAVVGFLKRHRGGR
jgi:pimeloyl-ACP methyl ester carboxylesterase